MLGVIFEAWDPTQGASRYEDVPTCCRAPEVSSSAPRRGREGEGEGGVDRVRGRTAGAR